VSDQKIALTLLDEEGRLELGHAAIVWPVGVGLPRSGERLHLGDAYEGFRVTEVAWYFSDESEMEVAVSANAIPMATRMSRTDVKRALATSGLICKEGDT
jgi:hypothetical protein